MAFVMITTPYHTSSSTKGEFENDRQHLFLAG
jgi:hypothetical protein